VVRSLFARLTTAGTPFASKAGSSGPPTRLEITNQGTEPEASCWGGCWWSFEVPW